MPEPTTGFKHHFAERVGHLKGKKKQRTHEACPALGARGRLGITLNMPYDACFHYNGTISIHLPHKNGYTIDVRTTGEYEIDGAHHMRIVSENEAGDDVPHTLWLTSGVQIDDSGFIAENSTDRLALVLPIPHKQPNPHVSDWS